MEYDVGKQLLIISASDSSFNVHMESLLLLEKFEALQIFLCLLVNICRAEQCLKPHYDYWVQNAGREG